MTNDQAIQVLSAGAGVTIENRGVDALVRMAIAAKNGGGMLTIVGDLGENNVRVAAAGGQHVTFDVVNRE